MNRPPHPHDMNNMYRCPRPYNNRWRPPGPLPPAGSQYRPNRYFTPLVSNALNVKNEEHWCETCDRGFPRADLLDQHKQQHRKCNIDGCQFVAHPRVITKHIQMQHASGLYKKIGNLNNPEEINKWREERKKKYPTRTNIEKKAAECKEKIERGEKMALKRNINENQQSTDHGTDNKRRHQFNQNYSNHRTNRSNTNQRQLNNALKNKDQQPKRRGPKIIPKVPSIVENNKLKPFAGILSINMDKDDNVEEVFDTKGCSNTLFDDDYYEVPIAVEGSEQKPTQEPVLCGALTSLVCDYGSSDEEPDERENQVTGNVRTVLLVNNLDKDNGKKCIEVVANVNIQKDVKEVNNDKKDEETINTDTDGINYVTEIIGPKLKECDEKSDDDGPEEVKTVKNIDEVTNFLKEETFRNTGPAAKKNIPYRNNNHRQIHRFKHKVPSTLLYKLLHKEIRQERNIVLQCIRFIKKMNYFEKT